MTFHSIAKTSFFTCTLLLASTLAAFGQGTTGQRTTGQRTTGQRVADARQPQRQAPQENLGPWGQLPPLVQKHTDDVLKFWEFHSNKIQRYRCDFKRWEYDQTFHRERFQTYATGKIMYAKPDKGLFEVVELHQGRKVGGKVSYTQQKETELDKWICDGKTIFAFDHRNKRLSEQPIPENLQGQQIVEGPLPFFFGAKMQQIKARYWVRVKPEVKDKFWIEAFPKSRKDAANFRRIDVIIPDNDQFLPKAIIMHHVGASRTTFEFDNQSFNWKDHPLNPLKFFDREFFDPKTPAGWTRVKQPLVQNPPAPQPRPQPQPRTAVRTQQGPRVSRAAR